MRFITSTLFAVAALAGLVMGDENPIIYPDASSKIVAGYPFVITWTPTTPGTVTFTLRQGPSDNLKDVETIVSGTENDGTYEWTPKKSLPAGTNYAIKITDSAGNINYTPLITIQSDAPSTGTSTGTGTGTGIDAGNGVGTGTGTGTGIGSGGVSSLTASSGASTITAAPPAAVNPVYSNSTLTTVSTGYSNSTATGNLTHSSTRSSNPSTTSTSTEEPVPTGAASSLLKSPLALVVCVLGAVLYLN